MSVIEPGRTVLIAYDGSEPAGNAIDEAARLFPGRPALIVTVGGPSGTHRQRRVSRGLQNVIDEAVRKLDAAAETRGQEVAQRGAARARWPGSTQAR